MSRKMRLEKRLIDFDQPSTYSPQGHIALITYLVLDSHILKHHCLAITIFLSVYPQNYEPLFTAHIPLNRTPKSYLAIRARALMED